MTMTFKMNDEIQSSINMLSSWIHARHFMEEQPGLSVGIVYDQELIWSGYYGYANLEQKIPVSEKTLYRIASISKLFTATSILRLRDRELLNLDDPVIKYLPWFRIRNKFENTLPITIRNLITHTSGLPREAAFAYWSENFEFPDIEQLKAALPDQEAALPPNTKWKYSNLAVSLAGEVVAAVSGLSYSDYVKQNILDPLEMNDTYVSMTAPGPETLSIGYNRKFPGKSRESLPFIDTRAITPAANLATNVEDLAKFAMLQFRSGPAGGKQILDGWTLAEMHRPHWVHPDWSGGWGLGFMIWRKNGKSYVGHTGGLQGFTTYLVICPEDKIAAIALSNSNDSKPGLVTDSIYKWVAPRIVKSQEKPDPAATVDVKKYVGKYRSYSSLLEVFVLDGTLYLMSPLEDDPLESASKLIPAGEHVFQVETNIGFGLLGEQVAFELNPDGTVHRMRTGYNYSYPVSDWQ